MRPLCVSTTQLRDELGATASTSGMGAYITRLGETGDQNRVLNRAIGEAQSAVETRLGVLMFHTRVVTRPILPGKVRATDDDPGDYDLAEDGYPYGRKDFLTYGTIYLRRKPVVSIQRGGLRYGNSTEMLTANEWPSGWLNPQQRLGILHVLPILGMGGSMSAGAMILMPMISAVMPGNLTIPLIFSIDYTAGFLPRDFDPDEDDPLEACPDFDPNPAIRAIRFMAAANVLRILGRVIAPGGGAIGMDGLSQSWQGQRFEGEMQSYQQAAEEQLQLMQAQFPIPVIAV